MARKYTKRNTEYWKKDVEYSNYVSTFRKLAGITKTAKNTKTWKQGNFKIGEVISKDVRAKMLSRGAFKDYRAAQGFSGANIAYDQFHLLTPEVAQTVQDNLRRAGITKPDGTEYSIIEIQTRQLPQEVWDTMETIAEGEGTDISEYFFGS